MKVLLESGYAIQQDYMKHFLGMPVDDEDCNLFSIIHAIHEWWLSLPSEERKQTPCPNYYAVDDKDYIDSCVIWMATRRFVRHDDEVVGVGRLAELESDVLKKRRFSSAFGKKKNFDETQMVFQVWPTQKF